ncbi:MAG: beta-glucosidase, partial [Dictyoglomaceae bacterium]
EIFEKYKLFDIEPNNEVLVDGSEEIRISKGKDKILIYTPFNLDIKLNLEEDYEWEGIELKERIIFVPEIKRDGENILIKRTPFNSDLLFIGVKK